jgi:hypothetical protein
MRKLSYRFPQEINSVKDTHQHNPTDYLAFKEANSAAVALAKIY